MSSQMLFVNSKTHLTKKRRVVRMKKNPSRNSQLILRFFTTKSAPRSKLILFSSYNCLLKCTFNPPFQLCLHYSSKIKALEEQIQGLTQQLEQLNQQKEDKTAALELLIDSWVELETTMKQTFHGTPSSTDLPLRPQNEMQLMNSMKKLAHFVEKSTNEVSSLKEEISGLVQENLDLKKRVKEQSEFDKLKKREDQLKQELDDERDRASTLNEEVDNLKERLRCSEVIAGELKRQLTQLSASNSLPSSTSGNTLPFISNNNNPVALKQELKTVKEVIASREEMIQKLNEKYMRHRQVWEENERRANDEIKKLDEIIDRVVMTLSNFSPLINDCPPLKRLLEELTADQQNISNLSSTFV